jgi:hypothetical protein
VRRYSLDARFDPWGMATEVDGARHRDVWHSESDDDRQNELVIAGQALLSTEVVVALNGLANHGA